MGLIRKTLFVSTGVVRPNSKKQRSASKSIAAQRTGNYYLGQIAKQGEAVNDYETPSDMRPTFKCSDCAELILLEAKKCRFCGLQFSEMEVEERIKSHHELESSANEDKPQGFWKPFVDGFKEGWADDDGKDKT